MGAPYAQDLRDRVLAAYARGLTTKEVAKSLQVSTAWARRVKQRRRETGETAHRPMGGATVVKIDLDKLARLVRERPDATIRELHALLGVDCVESAVCMALKRLGLTFKKRRSMRPSRIAATSRGAGPRGVVSSRRSTRNG